MVFGSRGEDEAYFYLRKLGFKVVAGDHPSPRGRSDIDLIAWKKETLCFIEVKAYPAELRARRGRLKWSTVFALAREFLRQYSQAQKRAPEVRFDVISVYIAANDTCDITLFRDAFPMS